MSFLSALFGKKKDELLNAKNSTPKPLNVQPESAPVLHLRGKPDANGLYPAELVMLACAERIKTTETNFSSYFSHKYEIANPAKMLESLYSRGFLDVGSPVDMLPSFKVAELKEIASNVGIEAKGKKADIVSMLANVDPEKLAIFVKERKWKLTEHGQSALKQNPYIQYFLDNHSYDINTVGVTIWSVNEDFVKDPKRLYRDVIYRQLNDRMNEAYIAFQKKPLSGTADTYQYCECYRLMGLFMEEEGKSYINVADMYFQYLYKRINILEGLRLLSYYKLFPNDKERQKETIDRFYDDIQLYPFHRTELLRILDGLNIDSKSVRETLITSFRRAGDSGIMTEQETADFIIYELSGETDKSKALAIKLAKKAVKRI